MSRNLTLPFFPVPPSEYSQQYMAELARAFSVALQQMQNPGEGRNTTLVLTNLPTSASGLESGSVWNDSGTLKIVP
jgi:hypothetical protein